jgi:hypothetical protein
MDKPTVHLHKDSKLHYLLGKENVLFENGIALSRAYFDTAKSVPGRIAKLLSEAGLEKRGYDYAYACTTGRLRHKKGSADLVANAETGRNRAGETEEVKIIETGEQKNGVVKSSALSSAFLVTAVMALVGTGSAVMSAYHTSAFLIYGGKPVWTSVITGAMLILFSGTAFTAARYFFQEKGALCIFGLFFTAAGLAVIVYSMFSTLTVNFNQFKWRDDEQAVMAVESSEALAAHRERMRILGEEIDEITGEIAALRGEADYWRVRAWTRYDGIQERIAGRAEYLDSLRERYSALVGNTPHLVEAEAVSQETVYTFLAGLFKVKEDVMRFFVYVIPACLYDILAPFSLSVVLLLVDKRRRGVIDH